MVASGLNLKCFSVIGTIAAVAATLSISTPTALSQNRALIQIDGSSTVFPISEAMAEKFMESNRNVNITVGVSGTGGGFRKFCAGETDISNASRPIKQSEKDACAAAGIEYIEIPVANDALSVIVNPGNTWISNITTDELKKMWEPAAENTVSSWRDVNSSWPNRPLNLFGPGTDSGTFDYFTEHINGKAGDSRADYTASEDDNILVLGISRDVNALGYFGLAYYLENQGSLKAITVNGVEPSFENVNNGTYPLSRPLLIYVSKRAMERSEVAAFVRFYLSEAEETAAEVGYVPFTSQRYAEILGGL